MCVYVMCAFYMCVVECFYVCMSVLCVHISVGVCLSIRSVYIGGTISLITCICAKTHITKQLLLIFVINMYTHTHTQPIKEAYRIIKTLSKIAPPIHMHTYLGDKLTSIPSPTQYTESHIFTNNYIMAYTCKKTLRTILPYAH